MSKLLRRVWAEIDLDALDGNIEYIKKAAGNKEVMAVVKADAYGHSAEIVSKELYEMGIRNFAVSNVYEGIELRKILPEGRIVIFGYCDKEWQEEISSYKLEQTAGSLEAARFLSEYGKRTNRVIDIHIKVNTGMGRVGIDTKEELDEIMSLGNLRICGIYTHFSVSDSNAPSDIEYTRAQQKKLMELAAPLREKGIPVYSQNSGGILYHPDFDADIVRSGIITYGCMPNIALSIPSELKPILRLRAEVCQLKKVPSGTPVSYGRTFVTERETVLAVIPTGYADGYSRFLSNNGVVYINGKPAPICGRVCMDQMMVDVTDIDVKVGDIAELYSDTIDEIKVDAIADRLGTIGYELLCLIGKRVPRVAVRNDRIIEVKTVYE